MRLFAAIVFSPAVRDSLASPCHAGAPLAGPPAPGDAPASLHGGAGGVSHEVGAAGREIGVYGNSQNTLMKFLHKKQKLVYLSVKQPFLGKRLLDVFSIKTKINFLFLVKPWIYNAC